MGKLKAGSANSSNGRAANLGFEAKLWLTVDRLRNNVDAAEYKHVVPDLIFLKSISGTFEERPPKLLAEVSEGADPEDPDEYRADNVYWVPAEARWQTMQDQAKQPTIGTRIDEAMVAIERDNSRLKGILPKVFRSGRPALDKHRLATPLRILDSTKCGEWRVAEIVRFRTSRANDRILTNSATRILNVIGTIKLVSPRPRPCGGEGRGEGASAAENRSKDILGRVYEYFLTQFASAEGKNGGQFYTPRCVVRLLVEMLAPYKGRVYDPCCGSTGMFVQSEKFVEEHGGRNRAAVWSRNDRWATPESAVGQVL